MAIGDTDGAQHLVQDRGRTDGVGLTPLEVHEELTVREVFPDAMRRAFTQVRNGRPRPVLVELPYDLLNEEVPDAPQVRYYSA